MGSNRKNVKILEDVKINVKIKLSALWIAVMFIYIYADIKTIFEPGLIEQIIAGEMGGFEITQTFLFVAALLMTIPCIMLFLSLILKSKANRLLNIIVSILHITLIITQQFMPGKVWYYYRYYNIVELVFHLLIVWYAWKWPRQEA